MKTSLRTVSFWLLLTLSISPLIVISVIGIHSVLNQLKGIEVEYEKLLLEQQLTPVETQINVYKELIRFVSQLPAVIEILGRGEVWEGNIKKKEPVPDTRELSTERLATILKLIMFKFLTLKAENCYI